MSLCYHPTKIHFGDDSLQALRAYRGKSVVVVTDAFLRTTPFVKEALEHLGNAHVYDRVTPNPTTDNVAEIFTFAKKVKPDVLIAIGGGSPIDAAKAGMIALEKNIGRPEFVVIPTTCGTGSEVTQFSIITDQHDTKHSLISDVVMPDVAILNFEAVKTLPANLVAETGMDAVTHCIEAYLSLNAGVFSDTFAVRGMEMLFEHLVPSFNGNMASREQQLYASTIAGMAFSEAGLGIVHSLSHATGGKFHLPHGRCNSVLLTKVLEFNAGLPNPSSAQENRVNERLHAIGHRFGLRRSTPAQTTYAFIQFIAELREAVGVASSMVGLGATSTPPPTTFDDLASIALVDPCTEPNPKTVTQPQLKEIISSVWH